MRRLSTATKNDGKIKENGQDPGKKILPEIESEKQRRSVVFWSSRRFLEPEKYQIRSEEYLFPSLTAKIVYAVPNMDLP